MGLTLLSCRVVLKRFIGLLVFAALFAYMTGSHVAISHIESQLSPWYHYIVHDVYRGYPEFLEAGAIHCEIQRYDDAQECAMRMRFVDRVTQGEPLLSASLRETEAYAGKPAGLQGLYPYFWAKHQLMQQRDAIHAFIDHSTESTVVGQFRQSDWSDTADNAKIMDLDRALWQLMMASALGVLTIAGTITGLRCAVRCPCVPQGVRWYHMLRCDRTFKWTLAVSSLCLITWFLNGYPGGLSL